ncbi:DNA primase [Dellaglioa sp. P0083]|uniref:DNA primase n=1 Tax=Dellaglioa kimchii TaxID=3344667 RepID=UPI0038D4DDA2
MRIPENVIEQVRTSVNITDIISQYVGLKKSGSNFMGLCPFHEEKTPSFSVSEEKQIFHCFSCGRGGNVFKFLIELEGLSFPESVNKVAEFSGMDIDSKYSESQSARTQESTENRQLKQIHDDGAKLYQHILMNTEMGQKALDYLHNRGITDEIIKTFQIGFAPGKSVLQDFFKEKKVDYQLLRQSGLFIENQAGDLRERFIDRVMFPIRNQNGQVVAFSGRLLEKNKELPKYLNSPETPIFNKREILFNYDLAKKEIRTEGNVILFEGFMDVLAAYRSGVKNGVASMGTSLTNEQIYLLERSTSQLNICYDGDEPGRNATNRALDLLANQTKMKVGVLAIPNGMDPDEFVKKNGKEAFLELAHSARETVISFKMNFLKRNKNLKNESEQIDYIDQVLQVLTTIKTPFEQDIYINQLADEFKIDKGILRQQLIDLVAVQPKVVQQVNQVPRVRTDEPPVENRSEVMSDEKIDRVERAERLLLYRILHDHTAWLKIRSIDDFSFVHDSYQLIYTLAEGYLELHEQYEIASFLDYLPEESSKRFLMQIELMTVAEESSEDEFDDCVSVIMNDSPMEQSINQVRSDLMEANRLGNTELTNELSVKLIALYQKQQVPRTSI